METTYPARSCLEVRQTMFAMDEIGERTVEDVGTAARGAPEAPLARATQSIPPPPSPPAPASTIKKTPNDSVAATASAGDGDEETDIEAGEFRTNLATSGIALVPLPD